MEKNISVSEITLVSLKSIKSSVGIYYVPRATLITVEENTQSFVHEGSEEEIGHILKIRE